MVLDMGFIRLIFSMAGKQETTQKNYVPGSRSNEVTYQLLRATFPADDPKYSCIVVIHEAR